MSCCDWKEIFTTNSTSTKYLLAAAANMLHGSQFPNGCMIWQHAVILGSICATKSIIILFLTWRTGILTRFLTSSPVLFSFLFKPIVLNPTSPSAFLDKFFSSQTSLSPFYFLANLYSVQPPLNPFIFCTTKSKSNFPFPPCLFGEHILWSKFFLLFVLPGRKNLSPTSIYHKFSEIFSVAIFVTNSHQFFRNSLRKIFSSPLRHSNSTILLLDNFSFCHRHKFTPNPTKIFKTISVSVLATNSFWFLIKIPRNFHFLSYPHFHFTSSQIF